mmetsp:Transcript_87100/g.236076  ORF Transcript_87100/g.236076 Transcript_87100/m.236076 type:complete len:202 (-) Transcript_87100:486-1091(-)
MVHRDDALGLVHCRGIPVCVVVDLEPNQTRVLSHALVRVLDRGGLGADGSDIVTIQRDFDARHRVTGRLSVPLHILRVICAEVGPRVQVGRPIAPLQHHPPLAESQYLGQCKITDAAHGDLAQDGDLFRHRDVPVELRDHGVGARPQQGRILPRLVHRRRGYNGPIARPLEDRAGELDVLVLGVGALAGHRVEYLLADLLG